MELKLITPKNLGWVEAKIPEQVYNKLWKYIDTSIINEQKVNNKLAGNISMSLNLVDENNWFYKNFLSNFCKIYGENFQDLKQYSGVEKWNQTNFFLESFWVNFQNQYEFNPLHEHTGCIYSFVIWMKIPTNYEDQYNFSFVKNSNYKCASDFAFTYTDILGNIRQYNYNLNSECEGTILFFPQRLNHQVYPFYGTTDSRITISGNISINTSKYS